MEYILVGIGGALGSIARFAIGKTISENSKSTFPFGTFLINFSGAFLLGVASSVPLSKNIALLLSYGFLGAYTTFSTFMCEGFSLVEKNERLNAFIYITFSMVAGIIGFILGIKTVVLFNFI